jgi:hypothetical protein
MLTMHWPVMDKRSDAAAAAAAVGDSSGCGRHSGATPHASRLGRNNGPTFKDIAGCGCGVPTDLGGHEWSRSCASKQSIPWYPGPRKGPRLQRGVHSERCLLRGHCAWLLCLSGPSTRSPPSPYLRPALKKPSPVGLGLSLTRILHRAPQRLKGLRLPPRASCLCGTDSGSALASLGPLPTPVAPPAPRGPGSCRNRGLRLRGIALGDGLDAPATKSGIDDRSPYASLQSDLGPFLAAVHRTPCAALRRQSE